MLNKIVFRIFLKTKFLANKTFDTDRLFSSDTPYQGYNDVLIVLSEASTRHSSDDISQETTSIAGESSLAAVQSEINDQSEAENVDQRASFSDIPGEDHEKENEKEDDAENTEARRPSSRESVTSTASSSSERTTLIIRSASQVNKIVPDSSDVVVKSEKVPQDRPAISILNPDQLGATSGNVAGENLLNNAPFAQSPDPMLEYNITSGLQDGSPALQVSQVYECEIIAHVV